MINSIWRPRCFVVAINCYYANAETKLNRLDGVSSKTTNEILLLTVHIYRCSLVSWGR